MNVTSFPHHRFLILFLLLPLLVPGARAGWVPIGPFGGDARSLAADPKDPDLMYLGTRTGQIYITKDGGRLWSRLAGLHAPADWVVDSLSVDPTNRNVLYAGMWSVSGAGGGIYKSTDGGVSWRELEGIKGQSIRALAMAPSSSQILVAGSLEGVFRTEDGGVSWKRVSPAGHREIRDVESVAIDPNYSQIIYIGTWHLPWKTEDGGAHWVSIKKGIVDDSDIFSIVIDRSHTQTLFASACTGIYRSDTAGAEWKKINGIPNSSRRTRILALDLRDPVTLYAGTTEGLWRTKDGGESWDRLTHHTWVINAIVIDSRDPQHLYLGMDQSGVMESQNGGASFQAANRGFAQRLISRIVPDPVNKGRFYATLLQDGQSGEVLQTEDNGETWRPVGAGLEGRDVLSLLVVTQPSWKLLAGTADGIFEFSAEQPVWQNQSQLQISPGSPFVAAQGISVRDIYRRGAREPIYAATSAGLLESEGGRSWRQLPLILPRGDISAVATAGEGGNVILAATAAGLKISRDSGKSWEDVALDGDSHARVRRIASHPANPGVLLVGADTGLFRSTDAGVTWEKFGHGVPLSTAIQDLILAQNDPAHVVVASGAGIFQSIDGGDHYSRLDDGAGIEALPIQLLALPSLDGLPILAASPANGLFLYDGVQASLTRK